MNIYKFNIFKCKYGYIGIIFSKNGIFALTFPGKNEEKVIEKLNKHGLKINENKNKLKNFRDKINKYFLGEKIKFKEKLDLSFFSDFEKKVLLETKKIPYGEMISYKDLAEKINHPKSYRAVGNALKKNRVPIVIPCHRVVKSDGSLGNFSGGVFWKKRLLEMERGLKNILFCFL